MTFGSSKLRILLSGLVLVLFAANLSAQSSKTTNVKLQGQLVCSLCWFEADRKTTPYGTAADIQCAKECAEKGIPGALAVKNGDDYKLYIIEEGRFQKSKTEWLDYFGKHVEVGGRTHTKADKDYVQIDQLKILDDLRPSEEQADAIGRESELALKDLFQVEQKLSSYRGKIVILNFWATWCVPCLKEMPDLAAIQNEYAALGVQVIGASADQISERSKVLEFIKKTRINFPVWLSATTDDMKRFGLGPALPGTAIIGRDGRIISLKNRVVSQAELKKALDSLLSPDLKAVASARATKKETAIDSSLVPS